MNFLKIFRLFDSNKTKARLESLEKKTEEAFKIAINNQSVILDMTKIIVDLANDQAVISEHLCKDLRNADTKLSKVSFSLRIDDDDDIIN